MSACNFSITFTGEKSVLLGKARKTIESQGGVFDGNEEKGNFDITMMGFTIIGHYTVVNDQLNVVIDEKPMLIPCSAIETFLQQKLT